MRPKTNTSELTENQTTAALKQPTKALTFEYLEKHDKGACLPKARTERQRASVPFGIFVQIRASLPPFRLCRRWPEISKIAQPCLMVVPSCPRKLLENKHKKQQKHH